MGFGSWNINVSKNMPEKVATAMSEIGDYMLGAEYKPIAYLGHQQANGLNHAVLAEQTVLSGKDTKNIVLIIFNEKPNDMKATVVGIERILESGGEFGGVTVDVKIELSGDAKDVWNTAFEGFVGSDLDPFAVLGTQVTNGVEYIYAVKVTPVTEHGVATVKIVSINNVEKVVRFVDVLPSKFEASLGYSFTW